VAGGGGRVRHYHNFSVDIGPVPIDVTIQPLQLFSVKGEGSAEHVMKMVQDDQPKMVLLSIDDDMYDVISRSFNRGDLFAAGYTEPIFVVMQRVQGAWIPTIQRCLLDKIPHFCIVRGQEKAMMSVFSNLSFKPKEVAVQWLTMLLKRMPFLLPRLHEYFNARWFRKYAPTIYRAQFKEDCEYMCVKAHHFIRHAVLAGLNPRKCPPMETEFGEKSHTHTHTDCGDGRMDGCMYWMHPSIRVILRKNDRVLLVCHGEDFPLLSANLPLYLSKMQLHEPNMKRVKLMDAPVRTHVQWLPWHDSTNESTETDRHSLCCVLCV